MRYLKQFNEEVWFIDKINKYKINKICKKYNIKNYTINTDGSIDVAGDIDLNFTIDLFFLGIKQMEHLPIKFNKINGYFDCRSNLLTSFEGSPVEVNHFFVCNNNQLTSFKGSPIVIRGYFDCSNNKIKTFEYFPNKVGIIDHNKNEFYCDNNPIFQVWNLFRDVTKIELLNDCDIFRDEDTETPAIVMDRLNDFLSIIGKDPVEKVNQYNNI